MENETRKKEWTERSDAYISKTLESYLNLYRYRLASHFAKKVHTILDVGTGCGYGVHYLDEVLDSDLSVGIDISKKAVEYSNKCYKGEQRYFIQCSATHLPFKNESFDLITCFEAIEHIRFPSKVLKEIHRTLAKKGTLVVSTPNTYPIISLLWQKITKNKVLKNPFHIREYSVPEFRELLKREKFNVSHKMGMYTPIPILENSTDKK